MRREVRRLLPLVALLCLAAAPAASADEIVLLKNGTDRSVGGETAERERDLGFEAEHEYSHALRGFAADLSDEQVAELRADPEVAAVVPDRPVHAAAVAQDPRTVPAGVRRVTHALPGEVREAATGAVAVLDTGVDLDHPDLEVRNGVNCIDARKSADDDDTTEGHGTHVAGTIGAKNDGVGVTGVAPGTKIYAVKVLRGDGGGSISNVICGLDWVTARAASLDIHVANLSLGAPGDRTTCTDPDLLHIAICRLVNAGVTPVVAAGNDGVDFGDKQADTPSVYREVLTVAAMSDTDGVGGGEGDPCRGERDDDRVSYSNFATRAVDAAHLVAAPGNCILSTRPGGGVRLLSGTSMAAPHVAGLVALCHGEAGVAGPCAKLKPSQVVARMHALGDENGFTGQAGRIYGPLALLSNNAYTAPAAAEPLAVWTAPADQTDAAPAPQPVAEQPAAPAPAPAPVAAAPLPAAPAPVVAPPAPSGTTTPAPKRPSLTVRAPRAGRRLTSLSARLACPTACTATVRLRVVRASAAKLRLSGTSLATARVKRAGAVRLTLTRKARAALSRVRRLAVTVVADVRIGGRTARVTRKLTLRR
jgi:subtilisin